MLAAFIQDFDSHNPAAAVRVGERPEPSLPNAEWTIVEVRATSINRHDLFSAGGGVIPSEALPRILGMDAAGVDVDGRDVIIHGVINYPGWVGPSLDDPRLTGLSEGYDGTFAERVAVPRSNLVSKPQDLSFNEAACLPTAWLTAYRMLFVTADLKPGELVLVQGAAGGVSTALIMLGQAAGLRMWVTGRDEARRAFAAERGAESTFPAQSRLPERVDAVMDTVGAPTWEHSLKCVRKGGTVVLGGGTGGYSATTDLARIFVNSLRIAGSAMGTKTELSRLVKFMTDKGIHPPIAQVLPLSQASDGMRLLNDGHELGKIVLIP